MSTPADGIPWRPAWRLAAAMTNLKEQILNPSLQAEPGNREQIKPWVQEPYSP